LVVVVTVLTAVSVAGWWFGHQRRTASAPYRVVEVFDGDTIVVARGGTRDTIRLLGVDTPETHHPTKPVQCYGPEASDYTTRRLSGQLVRLEDDVETHDIYGRHLAYVYLDGARFDDELLEKGYARLLVIEPNHAHARQMLDEELRAKRDRRGLWRAC
jgi:micrococcal nuclease